MFNRHLLANPVARAALASLVALIALNIFALSRQASEAPSLAVPLTLVSGTLS